MGCLLTLSAGCGCVLLEFVERVLASSVSSLVLQCQMGKANKELQVVKGIYEYDGAVEANAVCE